MMRSGSVLLGGSGQAGGAAGQAFAKDVFDLNAVLAVERDAALEDLLVKNQMVIALANALHSVKGELDKLKGDVHNKDEQLFGAADETATMRTQLQTQMNRALGAERKVVSLEEDLKSTKLQLTELHERMEAVAALEAEVKALQAEKLSLQETMEEWKTKVKEALKEQRKKEQQHVQTEIEQRVKLSQMQELLDKTSFQLETIRLREVSRAKASVEVQTEGVFVPAGEVGGSSGPFSPAPGLPLREGSVPAGQAAGAGGGILSPEGRFLPTSAASHTIQPEEAFNPHPGAPLPAAGASAASSAPPFIVTVRFGSSDGWTVDTKHRVAPGTTVGQLITTVCEYINTRYSRQLDCAAMCLRSQHTKAKRWIHLTDSREVHSFAYFGKCAREGQPILLSLDPIAQRLTGPPVSAANFQPPGGAVVASQPLLVAPATAERGASVRPGARERSLSATRSGLPRVASRSPMGRPSAAMSI